MTTQAYFCLIMRSAGKRENIFSSYIKLNKKKLKWEIFKPTNYENDWKSCFSGEFENAAAKLGEKIFLPQKSLGPSAFKKDEGWQFKLCQFGVPLSVLKKNADGDLEETIELIDRSKNSV
jgi:hypothetical protein